jgi:hypothetical protein
MLETTTFPLLSAIDAYLLLEIGGRAFRIWFGVATFVGNLLLVRISTQLSLRRVIAAAVAMTSISWLFIAFIPIPLLASAIILKFLDKGPFNGWLIAPAMISALCGALIGFFVLAGLKQKHTRATIWTLIAVNLMCVGISCYGVVRAFRPPLDVWDPDSGRFAWGSGQVTLPTGFKYHLNYGGDTFEGYFTSPDGRLVIRHDIGPYAADCSKREGALPGEKLVEGARVWVAHRDRGPSGALAAVTFPDSGCANFYLYSDKTEGAAIIDSLALSFRPKMRVEPKLH